MSMNNTTTDELIARRRKSSASNDMCEPGASGIIVSVWEVGRRI